MKYFLAILFLSVVSPAFASTWQEQKAAALEYVSKMDQGLMAKVLAEGYSMKVSVGMGGQTDHAVVRLEKESDLVVYSADVYFMGGKSEVIDSWKWDVTSKHWQ